MLQPDRMAAGGDGLADDGQQRAAQGTTRPGRSGLGNAYRSAMSAAGSANTRGLE